jgi:hypothetical protein
MLKKISNTQLIYILLLLCAFALVRYLYNKKKGENTFQTAIIPKIDTNKVTDMLIYTTQKKGEPLHFTKSGKNWLITQSGYTTLAEDRSEKYAIEQIQQISPDRLATNDPAQWKDFNVVDTMGSRLILLNHKDTIIDIIVGKFGFDREAKQGISYMRLHGQKEVYGVSGFLAMNITQEGDSWRNRKTIYNNPAELNRVMFTYPGDSSFAVQKDSTGRWHFVDGGKCDSIGSVATITGITQQNYGTFVYKFDTNSAKPVYTLQVEGNGLNPVIIKAYVADTANKYVITSTMNPGAYFSGKGEMFSKLFPGKKSFLHHQEPKKQATIAPVMKKKK